MQILVFSSNFKGKSNNREKSWTKHKKCEIKNCFKFHQIFVDLFTFYFIHAELIFPDSAKLIPFESFSPKSWNWILRLATKKYVDFATTIVYDRKKGF